MEGEETGLHIGCDVSSHRNGFCPFQSWVLDGGSTPSPGCPSEVAQPGNSLMFNSSPGERNKLHLLSPTPSSFLPASSSSLLSSPAYGRGMMLQKSHQPPASCGSTGPLTFWSLCPLGLGLTDVHGLNSSGSPQV